MALPVLLAQVALAQSYPSAMIENAEGTVRIYLPDASKGFYRGTRFDWSGIISSLKWKGHEYFGKLKLNFWSRRLAYAPEGYTQLDIPPSASPTWQSTYHFYLAK